MKKKTSNTTPAIVETITKSKKRTRQLKPKHEPGFTIGDIEDIQFREDEVADIRASLLKWYDVNKRDLPWRRINQSDVNDDGINQADVNDDDEIDSKAYAVWVSEIMLQQTRVQTVISYFNRWMEKWPTVHHLAQASIEEVNEVWAGLGYYRRARFLLEGAKMVVEDGGKFPRLVSDLRRVKGIGEYTAGAIASIAFKEAVPVVDGNVIRVIARLKTISANPKDKITIKNIWRLAGQLVDSHRPGDFNQAVMELGATLCTPLSPNCSSCPVSTQCNALLNSKHDPSALVTRYPTKVEKVKQRHDYSAVTVVEIFDCEQLTGNTSASGSKFLLVRRPEEGLLAGLWEFPSVSLNGKADLVTRRRVVDDLLKKSFGLNVHRASDIVSRDEVGEYVHIFTHIRLKMYIELLVLRAQGQHKTEHQKRTCKNQSQQQPSEGKIDGSRQKKAPTIHIEETFACNLRPAIMSNSQNTDHQEKLLIL
ncbi:hypothetical protein E3N88_35656 [Mikania micrantha]|uniref:Adenine DNA glycosylase n=1 Tax=Mikania micrantha TaxID=192012 RepID=A0A5N6M2G5_9ASTR|nr:hypothetical protein E3N88_35656 [Mikania micrantha]